MQSLTADQVKHLERGGDLVPQLQISFAAGGPITIGADRIVDGSFSIDRNWSDSQSLMLGYAEASELKFELFNDDGYFNDYVFEGAEIYCTLEFAGATLPCGYFTIDERPSSGPILSIRALDRMARLNRPISTPITYPIQLQTLISTIATRCGVSLGAVSLANAAYAVPADPECATYIELLQAAAAVAGCNAYIDHAGLLRLKWFDTSASYTLTDEMYFEVGGIAENEVTITGIECTVDDTTYRAGTDTYTLDLSENPIVSQDPGTLLPLILAKVGGYSYRPIDRIDALRHPHLWPGDRLIVAEDNRTYQTIVTNINTWQGSTIRAVGEPETIKGYATAAPFTATERRVLKQLAKTVAETVASREVSGLEIELLSLNEQIANALGYYQTQVTNPDGSKSMYTHDKPTLATSQYIDYKPGPGLFASTTTGWNNGSPVWEYGVTQSGSLVMRLISAVGIQAEWISIGGGTLTKKLEDVEDGAREYADGIVTVEEQARIAEALANLVAAEAYAEQMAREAEQMANAYTDNTKVTIEHDRQVMIDALQLQISENTLIDGVSVSSKVATLTADYLQITQQINDLKSSGGNLIRNATFGTADDPEGDWWSDGNSWGEVSVRGLTWGTAKTRTWLNAKEGVL